MSPANTTEFAAVLELLHERQAGSGYLSEGDIEPRRPLLIMF